MDQEISRHDFLKITVQGLLGLSGLLSLAGLMRFLSFKPAPPPPLRFELGPLGDYPLGSRTVLQDIPALLIRQPEGFSALSLVCTHLGCTVESKSNIFACPCHGSQYDENGKVTRGPAVQPLQPLQVELTANGNVVVIKD
jgi:cytochrome b6-f complex iron-sulfur subunit